MADKTHALPYDALDYRIIQELHRNGRTHAAGIARAVGANERTVRKRIEQLIAQDVVYPTAIINPRAFGYVTTVEVFLEVEPKHEEEAVERLLAMQEIAYLAYGLGKCELLLRAHFKDNGEMRQFLHRILPSIPGVKVTGSVLVPHILRNVDEWMPKPEDFQVTSEAYSGNEG